ncbi:MAG: DUF177 domain-containing protein [Myxococcales bacterium]|nr:DUF177 domain-containing protein [Myxococcales bacterium]
MPEIVLHASDIDDSGKDYDFELDTAWLAGTLADTPLSPAGGPGLLHVRAQKNGTEFLIRGELRAELVTECCRCLGPAAVSVDSELTLLLSPDDGRAPPLEFELEASDLDRAHFTGSDLVLDDLVREHLVLECPIQPLCAEDCAGIEVPEGVRPNPEDFGEGDGPDPRLAPLAQLRDKLPAGPKPAAPEQPQAAHESEREE